MEVQQAQGTAGGRQVPRAELGVVAPLRHPREGRGAHDQLVPPLVVEARDLRGRPRVGPPGVPGVLRVDARAPEGPVAQHADLGRQRTQVRVHLGADRGDVEVRVADRRSPRCFGCVPRRQQEQELVGLDGQHELACSRCRDRGHVLAHERHGVAERAAVDDDRAPPQAVRIVGPQHAGVRAAVVDDDDVLRVEQRPVVVQEVVDQVRLVARQQHDLGEDFLSGSGRRRGHGVRDDGATSRW